MSRQKVDNGMIIGLTSNKLTGAMPAIDGSALTGIGDGVTKSASDPAINTNPSGGVGTMWFNTSSGEMFACTDATTNENVWYNVGGGTGDVQPWTFQGTISGYVAGGHVNGTYTNIIEKFSLTADGNATDVGDLLDTNAFSTGQSSGTHGYNSGGWRTQNPSVSAVVQKWTFAADANSTNVGNLTLARGYTAGESSTTHGYVAGGYNPSLTVTIDKFTFASDNDATDVADITSTRAYSAGQSSTTQGYLTGGNGPTNIIEKFPFASDANGTNIGNLTVSRYGPAGQQY